MPWESARKDPAYNTAEWRRKRNAAMKRAQWKCEIKIPGVCIGAATQVDHVAGLDNDRSHQYLRAACAPCHAKVTAQQGHAARKGGARDPKPTPRTAWLKLECQLAPVNLSECPDDAENTAGAAGPDQDRNDMDDLMCRRWHA